jgi:hypothetical protein
MVIWGFRGGEEMWLSMRMVGAGCDVQHAGGVRVLYVGAGSTTAHSRSLSGLGMKLRKAWKLALYFLLSSR